MLSASNLVVVETESFMPAMSTFPVVSPVLTIVNVTVESFPSRLLIPFQTPLTAAAVSAAGAAGGGGMVVVSAGASPFEHAATARARKKTLRIDASRRGKRVEIRPSGEAVGGPLPSMMQPQW
jgi:hypothetical protein